MKDKLFKGNMKYVTIAIIVVLLVFGIGSFIITSLDGMMNVRNIDYADVIVADKYINNNTDHYYVVVSENGDLFDIVNITNSEGVFNQIKVGNQYRFITKAPYSIDDKYIHILQVYNGTN